MLLPNRSYFVHTSALIITHMYLKLLPSAPVSKYSLTYITTEKEDLVSDILELLQNYTNGALQYVIILYLKERCSIL